MKRNMLIITSAVCAAGLIAIVVSSHAVSAQNEPDKRDKDKPPPVYNPYPPGILPPDLDSEIARVLREIDVIEGRAIERWHSLPLPTRLEIRPGPNPPVLKDTGTESIETLGELLLFDQNISPGRNQACTSCHMPYAGWSGPIPSVNGTIIAYPGTVHFRAGKRTAQRHTYSPFFPVLQFNQEQNLFFGGNFWDSRSTGYLLRGPDAEQAQGPPVDTQEMGFPDTACVAFRLAHSLKRYGARARSISTFRTRRRRYAQPLEGQRCLGGAPRRFLSVRPTEPAPTRFTTGGRSRLTHSSSPCKSAPSHRNSTRSWPASTSSHHRRWRGSSSSMARATAIHATSTEEEPLSRQIRPTL